MLLLAPSGYTGACFISNKSYRMTQLRPPAGARQPLLGLLLLIYLACAWRAAPALLDLLRIGMMAPLAAELMAGGTALLMLGVARSLWRARLGKICFLLAAVQLGWGAAQIGDWD